MVAGLGGLTVVAPHAELPGSLWTPGRGAPPAAAPREARLWSTGGSPAGAGDMEELRRSYSRLCKESGAEPQEGVLQQLHELPRGRLDLATQSLTVDTCRALGKLLQKEALLTQLVLSDCMLSEEGGHPRAGRGQGALATSESGLGSSRLPQGGLLLLCWHRCPMAAHARSSAASLQERALPSHLITSLRGFSSFVL